MTTLLGSITKTTVASATAKVAGLRGKYDAFLKEVSYCPLHTSLIYCTVRTYCLLSLRVQCKPWGSGRNYMDKPSSAGVESLATLGQYMKVCIVSG